MAVNILRESLHSGVRKLTTIINNYIRLKEKTAIAQEDFLINQKKA